MSIDQTLQVDLGMPAMNVLASGPDGQTLLASDPGGHYYELKVLSGKTFGFDRRLMLKENLDRLAMVDHPAVRPVSNRDFDADPASFRLELASHLDAVSNGLVHVQPCLDGLARLQVAAQLVDATAAAHRVGLFQGSFAASTILIDQTDAGVEVHVDFSGAACAEGIEASTLGVEEDLSYLQDRLRCLLAEVLEDDSKSATSLGIGGRQRALLRRWLRPTEDVTPSIGQWQSVLDAFLPEEEDLDRTCVAELAPSPSGRTGSTSNLQLERVSGDATNRVPQALATVSSESPKQLGRFELEEKIGEGGMGVVYRAVDQSNGDTVAVKVLRHKGRDIAQAVRRFRKEARLLMDAQNEHVTKLIEVGEDKECHYLAMEFIDGIDLSQWLSRQTSASETEALSLIADLASAMVDAHSREVVHRDIKPENIMLQLRDEQKSSGDSLGELPLDAFSLKLSDFGIARHVNQSESMEMTRAGAVLGTPKYMSPEQCKSTDEIGPTSDVYSMGVTLFQLLTGGVPFDAPDFMKLAAMHCFNEVPDVQKKNAAISDATARLVRRSMAKEPSDRFGDASQMLAEIRTVLRGEMNDVQAHPKLPEHSADKVWDKTVRWTLQSEPADLWPYVSNTERLNEAIGLPPVEYSTLVDPDQGVRKFGTFVLAGVKVAWEEHPFEWIEGSRMGILREFDKGPFKWFLSRVTLTPTPDGGTELSHQVTIEPRSLLGRILTTIEADWKGFRNLGKVYQRMDRSIQGRLENSEGSDPFAEVKTLDGRRAKRLQQRIDLLIEAGVEPTTAVAIKTALSEWSPQELAQVRPLALADKLGIEGDAAVDACLHAATKGLLKLRWDILCPTCRVSASSSDRLDAIDAHTHCQACEVDFQSNLGDSIELVFSAHPEIREINQGQYCIGGPEHSPHVVAQLRLEPEERIEVTLDLGIGAYLIRGPRIPKTQPIQIQDSAAPSTAEFSVKRLGESLHTPKLRSGRQAIHLHNDTEYLKVIRLERTVPRDDVVTATMASANPLFRKLYPQQTFATDNPISTENMTFVATTINNVDMLYATAGDADVYSLINDHHQRIATAVSSSRGALVKTVGEQSLSCFERLEDAVEASLRLRESLAELSTNATDPLEIGIAVHSGSALVTTQNRQLDYFGGTVRTVLSMPAWAGSDTLISESVYTDPLTANQLPNLSKSVETLTLPGRPQQRVRRIVTAKVCNS